MYLEIYEIIWNFVNAPGKKKLFYKFYLYMIDLCLLSTRGLIKGCCEVNDNGLCIPSKTPCLHRNLALFWDSFHPTEFVNLVTGKKSYYTLRTIL
uniref:GDSL esterase/lipase n=1 Tax=Salix viminalis TaxID=40686 RepID=A0A6N2KU72_SALVM